MVANENENDTDTSGHKIKIKCSSCSGWCYSSKNIRNCSWCQNSVHVKCFKDNLGCTSCCESLIPGFYATYYEIYDDYNKLNSAIYNPYARTSRCSLIGDAMANEEHQDSTWSDISAFLTHCQYKQQRNVKRSTSSQLKTFSMNIRSLFKNIDKLREDIEIYDKYDILCFNETNCTLEKLPNGINDVTLNGFHEPYIQNPIRTTGKGGGLAIYVHKRVVDSDKIEVFNPNPEPSNTSGEFQFIKRQSQRRQNERVNPKPWILPWLEEAIERKNQAYHDFVKEPDDRNQLKYDRLKKFCTKHVDKAKNIHYKKFFEQHKDNSKKQWQMINSLLNRKPTKPTSIKLSDENGQVSTPAAVAEKFNDHFSNIAPKIKSEISSRTTFDPGGTQGTLRSPSPNSIYIKPVTASEVQDVINLFKNKATLDTKIQPLKIANSCDNFTTVLAHVVNSSFEQGVFPQALKTAKVVPVHEGGSKTDIKNYRPISLLATFSKVFEKLMHNRVINFLDTYNILCENQYGFRPGRSCEHALLNAKDTILNSMSKKQVTLLLLIDFSKAFDLVDHSILLNKLEHYGIRGLALNWFKSYLKNRNQFVSIGTSESSAKQIIYGVPQGSILGPLLFIIYINDLPQISEIAKFIMYADDANIFLTGENINEVYDKLKILSDVLVKWVDNNGLALNLKKTNYMIFSRQRNLSFRDVVISGVTIERKTEARFLGVIIDNKLNWSQHISAMKMKMARYIGVMYKLKKYLPLEARLQIYHSFVQSHLNYCSLVWGFAAKSHIETLFVKQKMGLRAILPGFVNYWYKDGTPPASTKSGFYVHKILTVHSIIVKNALVFMHKLKNFSSLVPPSIKKTIPNSAPIFNVADPDSSLTPQWSDEYGKHPYNNSVFYKGPLLAINRYSVAATSLPSLFNLNIYKRCIKSMLIDQQNEGIADEWPNFMLYNIAGLRKSKRNINRNTDNNLVLIP